MSRTPTAGPCWTWMRPSAGILSSSTATARCETLRRCTQVGSWLVPVLPEYLDCWRQGGNLRHGCWRRSLWPSSISPAWRSACGVPRAAAAAVVLAAVVVLTVPPAASAWWRTPASPQTSHPTWHHLSLAAWLLQRLAEHWPRALQSAHQRAACRLYHKAPMHPLAAAYLFSTLPAEYPSTSPGERDWHSPVTGPPCSSWVARAISSWPGPVYV